jgi:uncharacterized membrane protein (UPF0127 family)
MIRILLLVSLLTWLAIGCNGSPTSVPDESLNRSDTLTVPEKARPNSETEPEAAKRCLVPSPDTPPPPVQKAETCPADPVFGGLVLEKGQVTFPDAPGSPKIEVELARSGEERARGLMYRTHLADNSGMLFVNMGPSRVQSFWMHNTCIPLDMMFIAKDGFVTGILENVPAMNDDRRSIECPVSYVLEVNAGWSRKNGVRAGQTVTLPKL